MTQLATTYPETTTANRLEPLSIHELRLLISVANRNGNNKDLSEIVTILATTGVRIGELGRLQWMDVDCERREITVNSLKTMTCRSIPIGPRLVAILNARRNRLGGNGPVIDIPPERLAPWLSRRLVGLAAAHLGGRRLSPQTLRHSFASVWMVVGGEINSLMAIMGWRAHMVNPWKRCSSIGSIAADDQKRVEEALLGD